MKLFINESGKPAMLMLLCLILGAVVSSAQHSLYKLGYPVNTDERHEICPVVSYDGSLLFFTRIGDPNCEKTLIVDGVDVYLTLDKDDFESRLKDVYTQIASAKVENPLASSYNQDIWYTRLINKRESGIFHPGYPINDALPNSICSNYGINGAYLVVNQFSITGGIDRGFSVTQKTNDEFTFPEPVTILNFNKSSAEVNVTASRDSSVLILSMNEVNGKGNMDLYVCYSSGNNVFSIPVNLGDDINTVYRESTPMISHDNKRLYFTSDRPGGRGGKDIYYSERKDFTYTKWSTPVRLDPPVNSELDDSHPHVMDDNSTIYFTSNRDGSSDIFKADLVRQKLDNPILLTIQIINGQTGEKYPGEVIWGDAYKEERPGFFRSSNGLCRYKFFDNKPIAFRARNRSLQSQEIIIDPQDIINKGSKDSRIELILYPDGIVPVSKKLEEVVSDVEPISELELHKTILLNNIYFERTKPEILPQSYASIQKLAEILLSRPRLYISIIGHTDNVGSTEALKKLSEDRAAAIKHKLIEKGVPESRISTYGYGGARPIAANDTEENKSKNRRVEIRIVSQ